MCCVHVIGTQASIRTSPPSHSWAYRRATYGDGLKACVHTTSQAMGRDKLLEAQAAAAQRTKT